MTTIKERTEIARESKRNLPETLKEIQELATISSEVALSCFYVIFDKKDDKPFVGISVRFAELIASSWGNIQAGAKILENNGMSVKVQGFVHDFEKNALFTVEVQRGLGRLSPEQAMQATNAASSIAFRNAVFKAIPSALFSQVINNIKDFITSNITESGIAKETIAYFVSKGVDKNQIMNRIHVKSLDKLTPDQTFLLIGIKNAIHEGDTTLSEAFGLNTTEQKPSRSSKFSFGNIDDSAIGTGAEGFVQTTDIIPKEKVARVEPKSSIEDIGIPKEEVMGDSLKNSLSKLSETVNTNEEPKEEKKVIAPKKRGRGRRSNAEKLAEKLEREKNN